MEARREIVTPPRRLDLAWWAVCIALALGIHAAAAALFARWEAAPAEVASAPLITIELEPLPVSPESKPTQAPPGPPQPQVAPEPAKPVEKAALPPEPKAVEAPPQAALERPLEQTAALPPPPPAENAELPMTAVPPPKSVEDSADNTIAKTVETTSEKSVEKRSEKKHQHRHASLASAPSSAEQKAPRAAAPAPGAVAHNSSAVPNWKSALVARLERSKRYPPEAQARGEQGVAQLAFSVDRSGGVHRPHIVRSSGSRLLDAATLDLVERAAPLPPPPPEIAGAQIAISVPIRYNIR